MYNICPHDVRVVQFTQETFLRVNWYKYIIQRVGYSYAASLIDLCERHGIVYKNTGILRKRGNWKVYEALGEETRDICYWSSLASAGSLELKKPFPAAKLVVRVCAAGSEGGT